MSPHFRIRNSVMKCNVTVYLFEITQRKSSFFLLKRRVLLHKTHQISMKIVSKFFFMCIAIVNIFDCNKEKKKE